MEHCRSEYPIRLRHQQLHQVPFADFQLESKHDFICRSGERERQQERGEKGREVCGKGNPKQTQQRGYWQRVS